MKSRSYRTFLIIAGILLVLRISGQTNLRGFDTINIIKPKKNQFLYQFNDPAVGEIQLLLNSPEKVQSRSKNTLLKDAGSGLVTVITGIGFSSGTDVTWKTGGIIKCNKPLPEWLVDLYCEGSQEKERERVRNEDGSYSVETEEKNIFYWDRNARGTIIEKDDTVGYFLIVMNPREDSLLKTWSDYVFSQSNARLNTDSKNKSSISFPSSPDFDFGIIGKLREKNFALISNGSAHKTWFFSENELKFIFLPDQDDNPFIKKKDRVIPYLLIDKNIPDPDRNDFFRMAIMSRLLDRSLK